MSTERAAADKSASPLHQPPFVSFIPLFDSVVHEPHYVVISSESTLADVDVARSYAYSPYRVDAPAM
jgi:hypothetical protein